MKVFVGREKVVRAKLCARFVKIMFVNKDQGGAPDSVLVENVLQGTESSPEHEVSYEVIQPGELSFDEDTAGGMGRHLGLTSTTFLM